LSVSATSVSGSLYVLLLDHHAAAVRTAGEELSAPVLCSSRMPPAIRENKQVRTAVQSVFALQLLLTHD
jgi:hypothetical protein